jgi:hypothetical protein
VEIVKERHLVGKKRQEEEAAVPDLYRGRLTARRTRLFIVLLKWHTCLRCSSQY